MKKNYTLFFALCLCLSLKAQYTEIGFSGGVTNYQGDLSDTYGPSNFLAATHLHVRYCHSSRFAFRGTFGRTPIQGSDASSHNDFKRRRNLSFRNNIYEGLVCAELNLSPYDPKHNHFSSPYIYAGIGAAISRPKAFYNGEWVDLRSLGTEGQHLAGRSGPYSLIQPVFPIGLGMKMTISSRLSMGFDAGIRFTLTDYLDDVSGQYPDYEALKDANPMASLLSYRTPEITNVENPNPSGKRRGNEQKGDNYLVISFQMCYAIGDLKFAKKILR